MSSGQKGSLVFVSRAEGRDGLALEVVGAEGSVPHGLGAGAHAQERDIGHSLRPRACGQCTRMEAVGIAAFSLLNCMRSRRGVAVCPTIHAGLALRTRRGCVCQRWHTQAHRGCVSMAGACGQKANSEQGDTARGRARGRLRAHLKAWPGDPRGAQPVMTPSVTSCAALCCLLGMPALLPLHSLSRPCALLPGVSFARLGPQRQPSASPDPVGGS